MCERIQQEFLNKCPLVNKRIMMDRSIFLMFVRREACRLHANVVSVLEDISCVSPRNFGNWITTTITIIAFAAV